LLALSAVTITLSAFLLFVIEPLIGKRLLPWFGGAAAVWSTCLVFYQAALLVGYVYARLLARVRSASKQALIHIGVLAVSTAMLWAANGDLVTIPDGSPPGLAIFVFLMRSIGLPFAALSATTPLVQHWLARAGFATPYRLFAMSNLASFAALLGYPLLIEPALGTNVQMRTWSWAYTGFIILCSMLAWQTRRDTEAHVSEPLQRIAPWQRSRWFALAACGSILLLAITNHIDQNVAAVPLLWVLPLAVYLLGFSLSFGLPKNYNRALWLRLLAFALGVIGYAVYNVDTVQALAVSVPILLAALFICCMFLDSELYSARPSEQHLASYYVMIAAGGAAGAVLVGIVAPALFTGIYELPVALVMTAALAALLTWQRGTWAVRVLWIAVTACMVAVVIANVSAYHRGVLTLRRSFYGSLRVVDSRHAGPQQTRTLFHGTVEHGAEFLWPPLRQQATTYYGPSSGIGILLRECFRGPKRVGVVGLGAGTLAAYGQSGDNFRFYEINQQVIDIARALFFYLRETRARLQIVPGDARLSLQRDTAAPFDVLVLDAFSGDAIPVHLLTAQAISLYKQHLKTDGVLAFHVSNDYLDLAPLVEALAHHAGHQAVLVTNPDDEEALVLESEWVLVTDNMAILKNPDIELHEKPIARRNHLRLWTDDYNDLIELVKTPRIR
jgi:SAM-dependent methyltransferase